VAVGYVDIHTHYDDEIYGENACALISELFEGGLSFIGGAGVDIRTSHTQIKLAERFADFYACAGIHPGNTLYVGELDSNIRELEEILSHPKCVALGEIGLDYHYENTDKELQKKFFEAQMELAGSLGIPVVIHDREAHGDCLETVKKYPNVKGVFHSFSGSAEMAKELVSLGWYISFSGVVTFKNARKTVEAAAAIPAEYILTETDSPYLTPVPFRGSVNNSGMVKYTLEKIAEIKNTDPSEMVKTVYANTKRFFLDSKESK